MSVDLQIANFWKRISAYLLDIILLCTLTVGAAYLLSSMLGYNNYYDGYYEAVERYAADYDVPLDMTQAELDAMTEEEHKAYIDKCEKASKAINADEEAVYNFNMTIQLSLLIAALGILIPMVLLEFVVPLIFGNGQTLGKKIFSIALVRKDSVKVGALQMFVRAILGKYALETMLAVYMVIMFMMNIANSNTVMGLLLILAAQVVIPIMNRDRRAIHDYLAGTVAVDISSQQIFRTPQDLINYKTKLHAEEAARKDY